MLGHDWFCMRENNLIIICMSYCKCVFFVRVDQAGVICQQEGIFRVNCMDCLDRTNVVQAAVARVVMEQQVRRFPFLDRNKEINIYGCLL